MRYVNTALIGVLYIYHIIAFRRLVRFAEFRGMFSEHLMLIETPPKPTSAAH